MKPPSDDDDLADVDADTFPPCPFSFTSNVDADALTHFALLPCNDGQ